MEVRFKTDQYRTKRILWNQYVKTHKQVPKLHEWDIIQRNVRDTYAFFTEFYELLENCNTKKKRINCESPADQNETIKEDTNKNDEQNPFTEMLKKEMEKEANFRREMKKFEKKFGRIYTKN